MEHNQHYVLCHRDGAIMAHCTFLGVDLSTVRVDKSCMQRIKTKTRKLLYAA